MKHNLSFHTVMFIGGLLFGAGLSLSNMTHPEVVISFLNFEDFGLMFVMLGAAVITGLGVYLLPKTTGRSILTGEKLGRRVKQLDRKVFIGAAIFGVGWGLSGICPGAAYASLGTGNIPILWALLGMFIGAYAQTFLRPLIKKK